MTQIRLIVTHPGQAHRDDFIATCLWLSVCPTTPVERREPTQEELDDPNVVVIDVGGRHEPELNNFDHHQLPREHEPVCALTFVLDDFELLETALWACEWFEFTEVLDSKGPFVAAQKLGITREAFVATLSPIEAEVIRAFGEETRHNGGSWIISCMIHLGRQWRKFLREFSTRWELLEYEVKYYIFPGFQAIDARCIPGDEKPTLALEQFCLEADKDNADRDDDIVVTITNDDRGDGYCLFRRNDDPRVDFSRLEGHDDVIFAHKGGFIAKTKPGVDCRALIKAAITQPVAN